MKNFLKQKKNEILVILIIIFLYVVANIYLPESLFLPF